MRAILIFIVNIIAMMMTVSLLVFFCFLVLHFVGLPLMTSIKRASLMQPLILFGCLFSAVILHFIVYRKIILPFRKSVDKSL